MKNSYDNLQFSLDDLTKKLESEKIKKKKIFS